MNTDLIKSKLLDSMIYFHFFCEEHQLNYSIVGGTLLGAVRHKGFIPWDDDIDIVMPREDYKKLIELSKLIESPYGLVDCSLDKRYIYPFAKLVNNNIVVEECFYIPYRCGVWIDIFPLDYTFSSYWARKLHFLFTTALRKLFILKHGAFKLEKRSKASLYIIARFHFLAKCIPGNIFSLSFNLFEKAIPNIFSRKEYFANLYGSWGVKETAKVEIFKNRALYEFEGYKFWGPSNADYWLKKVYGDYMSLPEEAKRISPHIGRVVSID